MNALVTRRIHVVMLRIVEMLARKDYAGVESLSRGIRLTASQIEDGIREYGRTITQPPDAAYNFIDLIPVINMDATRYSVRFRLYTKEEGLSDLELQATLIDTPGQEILAVEIDGILVA